MLFAQCMQQLVQLVKQKMQYILNITVNCEIYIRNSTVNLIYVICLEALYRKIVCDSLKLLSYFITM